MTKPYPEGTVFVSTTPAVKNQPTEGAGFAPVYVPFQGGGAWTAPGYATVQPAGGGPRVVVDPSGNVLVEVMETPPLPGTAPAPIAMGPTPEDDSKDGGAGLLAVAALLALLFAG
jgi:hypothetical protein